MAEAKASNDRISANCDFPKEATNLANKDMLKFQYDDFDLGDDTHLADSDATGELDILFKGPIAEISFN